MRTGIYSISLGVLLSISGISAQAGPPVGGGVDGGGGVGIVCRDGTGAIASAEVLDLYEGRAMYGLNIVKSNDPMDVQIQRALKVIPPTSRSLIQVYTQVVLQNMRLTPAGTQLLPINDSFQVIMPKGCAPEQLANYYNDSLILISGDIWAALGETDRAALIVHEALYAVNRLVGATNSRQSRHAVAHIFAPATSWVDVADGVPAQALRCMSPQGGLVMSAFPRVGGGWVLQFQVLGSNLVMSKKTAQILLPDFDLNEAKTFPVMRGEDRIGIKTKLATGVHSLFEGSDILQLTRSWEAVHDQNGRKIPGLQTPRYSIAWTSGHFPNTSMNERPLNCSVEVP